MYENVINLSPESWFVLQSVTGKVVNTSKDDSEAPGGVSGKTMPNFVRLTSGNNF